MRTAQGQPPLTPPRKEARATARCCLLDPCSGRRLYTRECRELLQRQQGASAELSASHLLPCDAPTMLQRLSRNLRQLHLANDDYIGALIDAERVLELAYFNSFFETGLSVGKYGLIVPEERL